MHCRNLVCFAAHTAFEFSQVEAPSLHQQLVSGMDGPKSDDELAAYACNLLKCYGAQVGTFAFASCNIIIDVATSASNSFIIHEKNESVAKLANLASIIDWAGRIVLWTSFLSNLV